MMGHRHSTIALLALLAVTSTFALADEKDDIVAATAIQRTNHKLALTRVER